MTIELTRRPLSEAQLEAFGPSKAPISRRAMRDRPRSLPLLDGAPRRPTFAALDTVIPQARLFHSIKRASSDELTRPSKEQEWRVSHAGALYGLRSTYFLGARELKILLAISAKAHQDPERCKSPFECADGMSSDNALDESWAAVQFKVVDVLRMLNRSTGGKSYSNFMESLRRLSLVQMASIRKNQTTWVPLLYAKNNDATGMLKVNLNPFIANHILNKTKDGDLWSRISLIEIDRVSQLDVAVILCANFSGNVGHGKTIAYKIDELRGIAYPENYVAQNTINQRNSMVRQSLQLIDSMTMWKVWEIRRGHFAVTRPAHDAVIEWETQIQRGTDNG